jgi:hypothetical protein
MVMVTKSTSENNFTNSWIKYDGKLIYFILYLSFKKLHKKN